MLRASGSWRNGPYTKSPDGGMCDAMAREWEHLWYSEDGPRVTERGISKAGDQGGNAARKSIDKGKDTQDILLIDPCFQPVPPGAADEVSSTASAGHR